MLFSKVLRDHQACRNRNPFFNYDNRETGCAVFHILFFHLFSSGVNLQQKSPVDAYTSRGFTFSAFCGRYCGSVSQRVHPKPNYPSGLASANLKMLWKQKSPDHSGLLWQCFLGFCSGFYPRFTVFGSAFQRRHAGMKNFPDGFILKSDIPGIGNGMR